MSLSLQSSLFSRARAALRGAVVGALVTVCVASCGSRTGLADESYVIDTLACQATPFRARPGLALPLSAALPRAAVGRRGWW